MKLEEFLETIAPLAKQWPHDFNDLRVQMIFERMKSLDVKWLQKIVSNIILANNRNFDFEQAARDRINHLHSVKFAEDVSGAIATWDGISDKGLDNALRKFDAKSLIEAIENCIKDRHENEEKWWQK